MSTQNEGGLYKSMKFISQEQKKFYQECIARTDDFNQDVYHKALYYTLGLTEDCRNHMDMLYNFKTGCVQQINGNDFGWITGTDRRIIRLAYNLYNNGYPTAVDIKNADERRKEIQMYSVSEIFSYLTPLLIEGCFEAIRIRYIYN